MAFKSLTEILLYVHSKRRYYERNTNLKLNAFLSDVIIDYMYMYYDFVGSSAMLLFTLYRSKHISTHSNNVET